MLGLLTSVQFKSRPVSIFIGVVDLVFAYFVVSRALDTGSWLEYLGTLILLVLGMRLIIRGVKSTK